MAFSSLLHFSYVALLTANCVLAECLISEQPENVRARAWEKQARGIQWDVTCYQISSLDSQQMVCMVHPVCVKKVLQGVLVENGFLDQ